jgi:ABC-type multidrug transport system ATPase subunit
MISPIGSERPTYDAVAKVKPTAAAATSPRVGSAAVVTDPQSLEMAELPHPDEVMVPISSIATKRNAAYQLSALPFTPVTLSWSNLDYSVTLPTGEERSLLHNVNGFASPGEMTALMGASGAGKTTLMDVIAGRKTTGHVSADIRLNGQTVDVKTPYFQQLCGYCEQMDLHIGTSTVQEALRFSAHLRLPKSVSQAAQHKFVDEVMDLLALTPFANSLIGDAAIPGLAPAQLKLVTIGVELVANPSILFLDEPTSGLDAPAAWRVMTAIKRIALTGRNVLCTIHQPAARLFFLFDRLLLLKPGGKTIYFHSIGKRAEVLTSYFEAATKFQQTLPAGVNPANWMLEVSSTASHIDWSQHWNESRLNREEVTPLIAKAVDPETYTHMDTKLAAPDSSLYCSWLVRYIEVQKRLFVSYWRNGPMNITRAFIALVVSLLIGILYYKIRPSDYAGLNSTLAGLFMTLGFGPSLPTSAALPTLFRQRAVYYRESTVRMYDHIIYAITVTVAEFVTMTVLMMIYIIPLYFLMDLAQNAVQFWRMYLILFLLSQIYAALSQFYLAFLPNQISASVVHAIVFSFLFVFGGLLVPTSHMPQGWKWFHHMISTPKAYIAVALSQLSCPETSSLSDGMGCGMITIPESTEPVQVYEYVAGLLENSVESYGNQVGWLLLQISVIKIVTIIGFRYVSHLKR